MRVRVGDVRLFFDVDGAELVPDGPWMRRRPTVLLLHPGPGFDHALYKVALGPELARHGQVVYVDQRGQGRSDGSPLETLTLETWADDVRAFCDRLGLARPFVLGLGFGAMVAAAYGARHPDHPAGLVLCNPAARVVPARSVAVYRRLGGERAGEAVRLLYEQPSERTFAGFLQHCFPYTTRYALTPELAARADWNPELFLHWKRTAPTEIDLRDALAAVRAPTLVLAGEDDPEMTFEAARETVAALPAEVVSFHSFPHARHSVFRDAPDAFHVLLAFLCDAGREERG